VNKKELIDDVTRRVNTDTDKPIAKTDVTEVFERIVDTLFDTLGNGDEVVLGDLGKLTVRRQEARMARNPATGESVPAKNVVKFKVSSRLKDAVA
jgi:DNA-binding protein HU-beta